MEKFYKNSRKIFTKMEKFYNCGGKWDFGKILEKLEAPWIQEKFWHMVPEREFGSLRPSANRLFMGILQVLPQLTFFGGKSMNWCF